MSENILISELRAKIMSDPTTKAMMTPATRNAIFLDVDGDGPADFGFLCSNMRGDVLDMITIDLTNDGSFDFYIYNCQTPESESYVYYKHGSDVPMQFTPKGETASALLGFVEKTLEMIRNFNGPAFAKFFKEMKAAIVTGFGNNRFKAVDNIYLSDLRAKILGHAETKDMFRPASRSAILVDIDADGPADFAFLSSDEREELLDTIGIDLTGKGLFDLYLFNCLDVERAELIYYPPDINAPAEIVKEGELYETTMAVVAKAVDALYNFDAATFGETFRGLKKQMIAFSENK